MDSARVDPKDRRWLWDWSWGQEVALSLSLGQEVALWTVPEWILGTGGGSMISAGTGGVTIDNSRMDPGDGRWLQDWSWGRKWL